MFDKIIKIIDEINKDIEHQIQDAGDEGESFPQVTLKTDGKFFAIMFADTILFSNEDQESYVLVNEDELEEFLRNSIMEICALLSRIEL